MSADHFWWMFLFHDWTIHAVAHRFQPFMDLLTREIRKDCGAYYTDVLYVCECGKTKTKAVKGTWTLDQLKGKA